LQGWLPNFGPLEHINQLLQYLGQQFGLQPGSNHKFIVVPEWLLSESH
jgi:hypothetical protein